MSEVVFLKGVKNVDSAIELGLLEDDRIIIALTFSSYYNLKSKNINAIPVWDFIDDSKRKEYLQKHKDIIDNYWDVFFNNTKYADYKHVALYSLVFFLQEALYSIMTLKNVFQIYNPSKIWAFVLENETPCDEMYWENSVFDSILEFICGCENVELIKLSYKPGNYSNYQDNSKYIEYIQILFQYSLGFISIPYWKLLYKKNKDKVLLNFLSADEHTQRQFWFFDHLNMKYGFNIINLWDIRLRYLKVYVNGFFSKYLNKIKVNNEVKELIIKFKEFCGGVEDFPEIFSNSLLEYQWTHLLKTTLKNIRSNDLRVSRLKRIFHPEFGVISIASHPSVIATSIAMQNQNIKTILLSHSILPEINKFYYNYHDFIVASTEYQCYQYAKMGIKNNKIIKVNDQRFSYVDFEEKEKGEVKFKYGLNNKFIITIITKNLQKGSGLFPKDDLKYYSMAKYYNYLTEIKNLQKVSDQISIIIKSHPKADYYEFYEQLEDKNIIHIIKESLSKIINISSLIIVIGVLTDALFEAEISNKKIIFCDIGLSDDLLSSIKEHVVVIEEPKLLRNSVENIFNEKDFSQNNGNNFNRFLHIKEESSAFTFS